MKCHVLSCSASLSSPPAPAPDAAVAGEERGEPSEATARRGWTPDRRWRAVRGDGGVRTPCHGMSCFVMRRLSPRFVYPPSGSLAGHRASFRSSVSSAPPLRGADPVSRISRAGGRPLAPARFARLIARARGGRRAHLSRAFLRGFFAPGRKRRNRLRECRFLMPHSSTISPWSSPNEVFFRIFQTNRVFQPGSGHRRQARARRKARAPRRSSHGTANGWLRDAGPVPKTVLKPGANPLPCPV